MSAWREAPCCTDRELAALGWTDALTKLSEGHTHDNTYEALKAHFTEEEQVKLTLLVNIINGWNRIAIGFSAWADPADVKRLPRPLLLDHEREIRRRSGEF